MKQLEVNNVAARLKHRITFERPVYTLDALAATQTSWLQVEEAWASIDATSAKETNVSGRLSVNATYKIYVRKYHNVQTQMRIIFENKVLTIRAIINNPNYKELIEILADEENVHA